MPIPSRNRLAKPLPDQWRRWLVEQGVPKRKYTAVCRATLAGGRVIDELVIDQGWIISLDRSGVSAPVTQRIDFDPRMIESLELIQFV
jgi:hypothetical protein